MNVFTLIIKSVLVYSVGAALLSGCATQTPPAATPYALEFSAARDVNADDKKRPAPILVRVFELRSPGIFSSSNFFSLQDQAETMLGKDLVEMEQFVLRPGETKVIQRGGNAQVRNIGILAEYRLLDKTRWRQSIALPEPQQASRFGLWQTQPDRLVLRVGVNKDGIDLLPQPQ